ncbi:MAG: transpeptidase family protein [Candidatus Marinimicrobia bacterium]|nr:transpeptidase family protein [Candidatus Neomarinimicrobiota bacterium]MCF7879779.1 transpeptidase family protein [Candidatus Neomarinimicrobiota bacterium]
MFILAGSLLLWMILVGKLYLVQVVQGEDYQSIGKRQAENREPIPPIRGNIYDRNQKQLTMNIPQYSFAAHPHLVENKNQLASKLASVFGSTRQYYLRRLNSPEPFVWLDRNVEKSQAEVLLDYEDPGFVTKVERDRYYPYKEIASQITGFTNVDGKGVSGIEAQFDSLLTGKPGWTILRKDGLGSSLPSPRFPSIDPIDGHDVELTIDFEYQTILNEALSRGMEKYRAETGMAILMNPSNGAILAMTSLPSYNPNDPGRSNPANMKNRTITNIYEPGSTFKIVTATAALAEDIVEPQDIFFCEQGKIKVKGEIIHDWKPHGWLTFEDVIVNSSNVGTIKIAEKVGAERLYTYLRKFGFGTKTGIDLASEVPGIVHPLNRWTEISTASISIGHEISATALQMANAFAAVANNGYLMKPYIVDNIRDQNGKIVHRGEPTVIRQVASPEVMKRVKSILEQVVMRGTGENAHIDGIRIAGKTGTAQKNINGTYSETEYVSSFIGFLPVDEPELLCAVILDSPKHGMHWGGYAAAPIVKNIFSQIINSTDHYFIAEDDTPETKRQPRKSAQPDRAEVQQSATSPVALTTQMLFQESRESQQSTRETETNRMPDVRNMSLRAAIVKLYELGLEVEISGSGKVQYQSPRPGAHVSKNATVYLELSS